MPDVIQPSCVLAGVALGSNLGDRERFLREAVAAIAALPHSQIRAVSGLYTSAAAEGAKGSGAFLNAVLILETRLDPYALLAALQGIEALAQRERPYHHAPRTLDLDILFYGQAVIADPPRLMLPHPRLAERDFVMRPLAEIRHNRAICEEEFKFLAQFWKEAKVVDNNCQVLKSDWVSAPSLDAGLINRAAEPFLGTSKPQ